MEWTNIAYPDNIEVLNRITAICAEIAREYAKAQGISAGEELLRLVVHGTLHVLGYDHPTGAGRTTSPMWRRQESILARVL